MNPKKESIMPATYTHTTHTGGGEMSAASLRDLHECHPTFAVSTDLTLPEVGTVLGRRATFVNASPDGQGTVNVHPYDGETINGVGAEWMLEAAGNFVTLQATPGGWVVVG
jgi:hypothetical protein